jgi:hypothetical protein
MSVLVAFRSGAARGGAVLLALAALALAGRSAYAEGPSSTPPPEALALTPSWDQIANIKDAAERLGKLHRAGGVKAAYDFIDACYRTHSLAENYGQAFESCIAQDYLETKVLAEVYARMPPEALKKLGAPSPAALADSMGRRVVAAFSQYKMPAAYGEDLKRLVDLHGLPVFLKIVFPEAVKDMEDKPSKERK